METIEFERNLAGLKSIYVANNDKILFVVDENHENAPIARIFGDIEHEVVYIPEVKNPGENYSIDENKLNGKTILWLITTVSASHSPISKKAMDSGIFLISNPGMTPDWAEILTEKNKTACANSANVILEAIGGDVGGIVHIKSKAGTNIHLAVPNQNWWKEIGTRNNVGTNGPFGELGTAPFAGSGKICLTKGDFATNPINEISEDVTIFIRDNMVQTIHGGKQADHLLQLLINAKTPKAYSLAELAIQLNPGTPNKIFKSVIAEKVRGGIHVAIGTNTMCLKKDCPEINKFQFGRYNAGVHIDLIQFGTTVTFFPKFGEDGITIIRDGELLF